MKRVCVLLCGMVWAVWLMGAQRSSSEAAQAAADFLADREACSAPSRTNKAVPLTLAHQCLTADRQKAAFYVFNRAQNGGFVIVSADDRAETILGYADRGAFDIQTANPAFRQWLNRYQEQLSYLSADATPSPFVTPTTPIPNMLVDKQGTAITWDQLAPYNNLCPIDQTDNTRSMTGCIATAAAQVLRKWCYPSKGTGSHTYTWYNEMFGGTGYGTESVDFAATTYDWDNMLPAYTATATDVQQTAVATLMYHCGVASDMIYGGIAVNGSGTWTDYMAYGLHAYFGYRYTLYVSQDDVPDVHSGVPNLCKATAQQIFQYLNADLEAGRPVIMGCADKSAAAGHEIVCSGRDADNRFYLNFGWSGDSDGYYALDAIKEVKGYDLSYHLDAIIGLEPDTTPTDLMPATTTIPKIKCIRNGHLIIMHDRKAYNALGQSINNY